jgi:hypothetical protein
MKGQKESTYIYNEYIYYFRSWDSVGTGYGLEDRGVRIRVPVGLRNSLSPQSPDWLWGPPNLSSNGYRG